MANRQAVTVSPSANGQLAAVPVMPVEVGRIGTAVPTASCDFRGTCVDYSYTNSNSDGAGN